MIVMLDYLRPYWPPTTIIGFSKHDLVAGITGYKVKEMLLLMAQSVHGWGLFLKPDSVFR